MLRKNKIIIIGKDDMGITNMMESDDIYRNFHPEHYAVSIINGIKTENIPNFTDAKRYTFLDKEVEFKLENIKEFKNGENEYTITRTNLYDVIYVINISDTFENIKLIGDCVSKQIENGINLAPRTMTVFLLDKVITSYIDSNNNRRFIRINNEADIELEYNIYMTRLL